jgi:hypothetical protein
LPDIFFVERFPIGNEKEKKSKLNTKERRIRGKGPYYFFIQGGRD